MKKNDAIGKINLQNHAKYVDTDEDLEAHTQYFTKINEG